MDNYESAITALKIPFFPLGLIFPAGDVLDTVVIVRTINFSSRNCLLSPFLPFSTSASLLMANAQ